MPELPEVETVRRGLQPHLEGHRLTRVQLNRPDLRFPLPERMAERLTGAEITSLSRRAKFLIAETDRGERLIMHLGMSGRFTIETREDRAETPGEFAHARDTNPKHDHVEFITDAGTRIVFNDPRRFGYMQMFTADETPFEALGPEPLSNAFNADYLYERFRGKKSPVKSVLLDQSVIAGLGNIYVCEALYRSGISPKRLASNIGKPRIEALTIAIRDVLNEAIEAGGSSLKDFANTEGGLGYFQHSFAVYGRENEPCRGCAKPLKRLVQSGRSTFYCSACQK